MVSGTSCPYRPNIRPPTILHLLLQPHVGLIELALWDPDWQTADLEGLFPGRTVDRMDHHSFSFDFYLLSGSLGSQVIAMLMVRRQMAPITLIYALAETTHRLCYRRSRPVVPLAGT